MKIFTGQ